MLSLPLAKLSVAQDADAAQQRFTWHHEQHQLTFVIDTYNTHGSSQLLKVVQGTRVSQSIELERLIKEGDELAASMRDRGLELKADQLPVSAIVRCPLLAIRWQLPDKKVRRLQLKFKSSQDFDTAYTVLHQLGLHMTSSENHARARSPTSVPERASTNKPGLSASTYILQSASGGLSCPPSRLADVSSRPYTATNAPTYLESQLQEAAHMRPMSAITGNSDPLAPPVYFPRPSSGTSDMLGQSSHSPVFFPPRDLSREGDSDGSGMRPETAMLYSRPNTTEALLPPRRELPFQRLSAPLSSGSDTARPLSRPSTGLMGPPPLPARVASLRPGSNRGVGQENELPPLPQPTSLDNSSYSIQTKQRPPRTPTGDNTPTLGKTSPFEDSDSPSLSSRSPVSSPLSFSRPGSATQLTSRPLSAISNAVQNLRRTMSQDTEPITPPTSSTIHKTPTESGSVSTLGPGGSDNLAAYVMQSEDGRRAALNEFIFQNLESDDFLTLIEDMETCWARAALGMQ